MEFISFVFKLANTFVDAIGWLVAGIINFIVDVISNIFSWGIEQIKLMPGNIQIPICLTLAIIFIAILLASVWFFPHIVIILLVVIPISIFLLKIFIGWLVLFVLFYLIYRFCKNKLIRLSMYLKGNSSKSGGEIDGKNS
ncbi:hypothetical protein NGG16_16410 [Enterococcus casseliflavus]|uniref:hypothetical protein n=1 Tax=Enterococcus casseliflavus TaxID=37734 RepID=UPI002DB7365E|nr:hypothetical protein [Enterococcus casseliflavus]MEB8419019.1 hypothetical protein [Enterococcus casseliflavus]